jgi:hypothetical protein
MTGAWFLLLLLLPSSVLAAGKLHTRYGFAIDADTWWEESGILFYEKNGVRQAVPRGDVERIEGTPGPRQQAIRPAPPKACESQVVTKGDLDMTESAVDTLTRLGPAFADDAGRLRACLGLMRRSYAGETVDSPTMRATCCAR